MYPHSEMRKFAKIYLLLSFFGYNKSILILNYKNMTHTILQNNLTPKRALLSESMMPPSTEVQALLIEIQEKIKQNPLSDSMAPPSDDVRQKLIEL